MAYSDLSLRDRAEVIRLGVQNGLKSLNDIKTFYDSAILENEYAEGGSGIHIDPKNRGKFNATKARTGKTTEELTHSKNPLTRKRAIFAQNARKWKHDDGGDLVSPALQAILKNRNSLDRKYDFIADTWDSEYTVPKGYNESLGLYFPYDSPEGGTQTVGPGIKLRADGKGDARTFSAEEAAHGVTKAQINEKLGNHADYQYQKVLEFLGIPNDTISPNIMRGLMDLRYQVGSLGPFKKLKNAVLTGDLEGIKKESKVTYKTKSGKRKEDVRRNQYRQDNFWSYSTGGPFYPFSFSKRPKPSVLY